MKRSRKEEECQLKRIYLLIPKDRHHILRMTVKCAECQCAPQDCMHVEEAQRCENCTKEVCCCIPIHSNRYLTMKKSLRMAKDTKLESGQDDCCALGACKNDITEQKLTPKLSLVQFLRNVKGLYAAALGIEILCIAAAEIGENTGLYLFGFNLVGIRWPLHLHMAAKPFPSTTIPSHERMYSAEVVVGSRLVVNLYLGDCACICNELC
jgi:hypothetical protein